jgi:hypothetical protein
MKRRFWFSCLVAALLLIGLAPAAGWAGAEEKNYGVPPGPAAQSRAAPGSPLTTGTRVRAVVDFPSGSDCIRAGDMGTLVCHDASDPTLPYLVNWDRSCGFSQSQVCGVTAEHGWWVGYNEIEAAAGTPGDPGGGGATTSACYFDSTTGLLTLRPVEVSGAGRFNVQFMMLPITDPFNPRFLFELDTSTIVAVP